MHVYCFSFLQFSGSDLGYVCLFIYLLVKENNIRPSTTKLKYLK